ncbi:hypothetical protein FQA39_LY17474 [Lamprigera yunnana]|nr:hypothetical protein FQA39_LY17474 [Lamprigera yunnana]
MVRFKMLLVIFLLYFFFSKSIARCPDVEPKSRLDMNRMLGVWYSIQKSDERHSCLLNNITEVDANSGHYEISESFLSRGLVNVVGLKHKHSFKARLQISDLNQPAVMDLTVPLIASFKFTILDTDYDNYAIFISCNKRPPILNKDVIILISSRTRYLDVKYLDTIHAKLWSYNINLYAIDAVDQQQCEKRAGDGVIVRTASNILNTVKKTVGGIAAIFVPRQHNHPVNKPKPKLNEYDSSVTGEYNIDVRTSLTD